MREYYPAHINKYMVFMRIPSIEKIIFRFIGAFEKHKMHSAGVRSLYLVGLFVITEKSIYFHGRARRSPMFPIESINASKFTHTIPLTRIIEFIRDLSQKRIFIIKYKLKDMKYKSIVKIRIKRGRDYESIEPAEEYFKRCDELYNYINHFLKEKKELNNNFELLEDNLEEYVLKFLKLFNLEPQNFYNKKFNPKLYNQLLILKNNLEKKMT